MANIFKNIIVAIDALHCIAKLYDYCKKNGIIEDIKRTFSKVLSKGEKEDNSKDEKDVENVQPSQESETVRPVTMKEIIKRNKSRDGVPEKRKLFAPGELHAVCAPTGMGKSKFCIGMGYATAGGKESEYYRLVKSILGDGWDTTKQLVEYIDGENGEDELYDRYGRTDMDYPDNFTVLLPGKLSTIDELEAYITQRAQENKSKGDYTLFIDQPRCYKGYCNHQRMQEFYVTLKNIISNYREGGYRLTIFIIEFLEPGTFCKPVSCEDIAGVKELKKKAHTIVALCPCRWGEEYSFLKVLKCRSYSWGEEVVVLKRSTDNRVFFHFVGKIQEEDALPLPARKPTASATSPTVAEDTPGTAVASVQEEYRTAGKSAGPGRKLNKVTKEILLRMRQLAEKGMNQKDIAAGLGLCRQTVNRYLQAIRQGKYELAPSPC